MDKKYQVFVSSTYTDLVMERKAVIENLLRLDCIPSGMELFRAANKKSWDLIKGVIDECDYYLVIVGGRYGSQHEDTDLSYTEMEYRYAVEKGKPAVGFVHKDIGVLPGNKLEETEAGRAKLSKFTALVKSQQCAFWTNESDLAAEVVLSINDLKKTDPAVGWVKGDQVPERGATEEILRLRQEIEKLQYNIAATEISAGKGTEQFSQGDDKFEISYAFDGFKSNQFSADINFTASFRSSWNDIFAELAPLMIDEASEKQLKGQLSQFCITHNLDTLSKEKSTAPYRLKNFRADSDDFHTIKVQLLALRLIQKSEKKKSRSVNDKETYWTLTPHGENVMMTLRAIRRAPKVHAEGKVERTALKMVSENTAH
ncbi:DUF4062 domain-containing protein [Variovorax sp. J22R24]|uniref:DUF4062 domain-containing protein n=1 Tax=Variovorax gracilis TaxID=3053502 RepID=UPI002578D038|nr:DUF4062 domain-containing protein [Variovorax sp. J22R24]MDM0103749.1 DUF4062 domain-containing protein [Variovorax sp. J22R24]